MQTPAARGLTADELNLAIEALRVYCQATVLDAVALQGTGGHDDVLLVLQPPGDDARKVFVHIALGGPRARVTTTQRRFGRDARARGPGADLFQRELQDATLESIEAVPGERRCTFLFATSNGQRQLVVELFGARGLWLLCTDTGVALTMSRAVETAVRTLRRGDVYVPPPPTAAVTAASKAPPPDRFAKPVLDNIDAHFTPLDLDKEQAHAEGTLRLLVDRNRKKCENKVQGMHRQLDNVERVQEMRATADLMLAYAHSVARGAASMEVSSLDGDSIVTIPLDPSKPVALQANKLYDKARRQEDGRAMTEKRLAASQTELTELQSIAELLEDPSEANLESVRTRMQAIGLMPKPKAKPATSKPSGKSRKKGDEAVPFRRFTSTEGYPIFVGRNNNQNDELTMRYAKGNDLWLHVGGGRPGSHVVVRLPKQKTASLETLLDAAALAVYYSKSRGEPRIEVIYTFKKNIKKPKGLPAGAVVPVHTKTVTVLADEQRLTRLLATSTTSQD
ncbi:MAG: putative ribosome quality control (RQC) complex YloA/Tae2 family protein [Hyphomicrobiaceae bacterium]|jgi:predicted ribosome quality control (RQC) complex YloA/Tae2 family protein